MTAHTGHVTALINEMRSDRPSNLTGDSGDEYSHFSIP